MGVYAKNFISFEIQGIRKVVKPALCLLSLSTKTIRTLSLQLLEFLRFGLDVIHLL
jgi:hypothetical protein